MSYLSFFSLFYMQLVSTDQENKEEKATYTIMG